jgi:hypothetical protein
MKLKKRLIRSGIAVMLVAVIGLGVGGNYFYNIAINRSQGGPKLHGGGSSTVAASVLGTEEEQVKMAELMKWTGQQKFEILRNKNF